MGAPKGKRIAPGLRNAASPRRDKRRACAVAHSVTFHYWGMDVWNRFRRGSVGRHPATFVYYPIASIDLSHALAMESLSTEDKSGH